MQIASGIAPAATKATKIPEEPLRLVGSLELSTCGSGELPGIEVPLYSGGVPPEWAASTDRVISDELRSEWERQGYKVEERSGLLSVGLGDGREAVVPVDDVRVRFVGRPVY